MALTLSMTSITPSACTEHELIAAARSGDDRAFEELYARYRERIVAFIHCRVGDHGRGEDVAQEVFISALRRLRASDQAIHFKPWIYEIAKNACIDEFRRTRRTREVSLDVDEEAGGPRPLLSLAPTPAAAVETKQRLADLRGAFGGLSENHHQLLVLRELEGLSYDEIGARTGMSRQMVESALFRARRKLTDEYNELASGRRCEQVQGAIEDGRALSQRSFGLRERRQFGRHLAHCQRCRTTAHMAGVDESLVQPRRIGAKIAALLPFPLWRWPWGTRAARHAAVRAGTHPAVQSMQGAALINGPAGASALGGAAVAAAVLVLTGAGVGLAPAAAGHHGRTPLRPASHPAASHSSTVSRAPAAPASGHAVNLSHGGRLGGSVRGPATSRVRVHRVSASAPSPATQVNGSRQPAAPATAPSVTTPAPAKTVPKTLGGATNTVKKVVGSTSATGASSAAGHALGATTGAAGSVPSTVTGAASSAASGAPAAANSAVSAAASTGGAASTAVDSALKSVTGR
jgi:RNA polymerase sigma factor (sigma-70 family)